MKDALARILDLVVLNQEFLMQVSADVYALKVVVSKLDPEVYANLQKEIDAQRRMLEQTFAEQRRMIVSLQQTVSTIPN